VLATAWQWSYRCKDTCGKARVRFFREVTVINLLLLLPFVGLLWVPFFNMTEPSLFGFPFFYWYMFAWVPVSSLITWVVWRTGR
jgi:hypothetical protein